MRIITLSVEEIEGGHVYRASVVLDRNIVLNCDARTIANYLLDSLKDLNLKVNDAMEKGTAQ